MSLAISNKTRKLVHLTTSLTTIYTCPAGTIAEIKHAQVGNVDGAADADVSVAIYGATEDDTFYPAKTVNTPADAALKPLGEMIGAVMLAGDILKGQASADGDLDAWISITEFTAPA
jgi:hypothetical protein